MKLKCRNKECKHFDERVKAACQGCRTRKYRKRNPVRYAFHNLKSSARKRSIVFELTYEEFTQWCADTGYIETKGKKWEAMTVGRTDANKGYSLDNMKLEKWIDNTSKGYYERDRKPRSDPF